MEAVDKFDEYPGERYLMLLAGMDERGEVMETLVEFGYDVVGDEIVEDARRRFLYEESVD
jgi:hypothetical protein